MQKRFFLWLLLPFLVLIPTASAAQLPSVVPSSCLYAIPVNIINLDTANAILANTQIPLLFNGLNYSAIISARFENTELFNGISGATVPAWIMGNVLDYSNASGVALTSTANVEIWAKIPDTIAASGSDDNFFLCAASTGTNLLSKSGNIGINPLYTTTYGAKDNGGKVFLFYENWTSTTEAANWNLHGTPTISDGLTLTSSATLKYVSTKTSFTATGNILEIYQDAGTVPNTCATGVACTMQWGLTANGLIVPQNALITEESSFNFGGDLLTFATDGYKNDGSIGWKQASSTYAQGGTNTNHFSFWEYGAYGSTNSFVMNGLVNDYTYPVGSFLSNTVSAPSGKLFINFTNNQNAKASGASYVDKFTFIRQFGFVKAPSIGNGKPVPIPQNVLISAPSNTYIDVGQTQTVTATITGGGQPYTYAFNAVNSVTNAPVNQIAYTSVSSTTQTASWIIESTDTSNSPENANIIAVDANGLAVNSVYSSNYIINPQLFSTSWTASNAVTDSGQYQLLTASLTGGTSPYTYNILVYNAIGSLVANQLDVGDTASSNTFYFQINSAWGTGTFTANIIINDSATSNAQVTNTLTFTSDPALNANPPTPNPGSVDNGQSITLAASVSGGDPPYTTYQWYTESSIVPLTCTSLTIIPGAIASTYTASPSSNTLYCYVVTDSATFPAVATSSAPANIIVYSSPTAILTAIPSNTGNYNTLIVSNVVINGGSGSFTFSNTINNVQIPFLLLTSNTASYSVCAAPSSTSNCLAVGPYTINVIPTDVGTTVPYTMNLIANVLVINQASVDKISITGGGTFPSGSFYSAVASIGTLGHQVSANDYINNVFQHTFTITDTLSVGSAVGTYIIVANTLGNANYLPASVTNTIILVNSNSVVTSIPTVQNHQNSPNLQYAQEQMIYTIPTNQLPLSLLVAIAILVAAIIIFGFGRKKKQKKETKD